MIKWGIISFTSQQHLQFQIVVKLIKIRIDFINKFHSQKKNKAFKIEFI